MNLKKRIKTASIMVTIVLVSILALTGCKPTNTTSSSLVSSQPASSQPSSSEPALKPYVIDYFFGGTPQTDVGLVEEALNKLIQPKINATVKLHAITWAEAAEKFKVMLAAGDKVDLIFTGYINPLNQLVGQGVYKEIDSLLTTYGKDILAQVPKEWWTAAKYQGKTFAVPNIQYAVTTPGVTIRKDLADKYKLDISTVKNFEALEPFLKAVKEGEKDVIPFCMYKTYGLGGTRYFVPNGIQDIDDYAGIKLDGDSYKVFSLLEDPLQLQCYQTANRWFKLGYIPADTATLTDVVPMKKANKFAAVQGNLTPFGHLDYKTQFGVEVINVPFTGHASIMMTKSIAATMTSIAAASKDPERAMMFLNLLFADKAIFRTLCNGIEGTHYTKVTDDIIQIAATSKYKPGSDWEFGNAFNGFLKYGDPLDKVKVQTDANKSAVASPLMGFVFDVKPVQTERAQMDAAYAEFGEGLGNGTLDPAIYYPKMIAKLKAAGLDKFIAEVQKQVTAWKTANGK